ncbi:hypothetical protein [Streptomyces sp. NPDC059991]|uniref:hypothetical protein n=1 Tax=unclassified Streptomyces TaxID=2593676 RepID=UPI00369A7FC0
MRVSYPGVARHVVVGSPLWGGSQAVLGWLAQCTHRDVLLVSSAAAVLTTRRRPHCAADKTVWEAVRQGVHELARRRAGSMAVDTDGHTVLLYPLDLFEPAAPVLVAVAPRGTPG